MSKSHQQDQAPGTNIIVITLALCCVVALACLYVRPERHSEIAWLMGARLWPVVCAGIMLLLGLGFGSRLSGGPVFPLRLSFPNILGAGFFLGIFSLTMLVSGDLGPLLLAATAGVVLYWCARSGPLVPHIDESHEPGANHSGESRVLFSLMFVFAILGILCAFTPPREYDDQEYHSGSVAYYLRHVGSYRVPENVYSDFPQNVEMWLYGLTRLAYPIFADGRWTSDMLDGIYAGKLIQVGLGVLTAILVGWLTKRCVNPSGISATGREPLYAMAFFYCSPVLIIFSGAAYVEIGLTFYLFLGLCLFLLYASVQPSDTAARRKYAILCGITCGLAAGCKYQGVLFGVIPITAFILLSDIGKTPFAQLYRQVRLRDTALFLLGVFVAFSPWLIRDLVTTGNPVFPLLYSMLGGHGWDAAHNAMWLKAHAPGPMTPASLGQSLWWNFLTDSDLNIAPLLSFLFIPLIFLRPRSASAPVRWVMAYVVVCCALWFLFTQRIDRFLAPVVPAMAVLSAVGFAAWQEGWVGKALKGVVAACLIFALLQGLIIGSGHGAFTAGLFPDEKEDFLRDDPQFYHAYEAVQFINKNVTDPKAKALFLGEARAFYCDVECLAPTVFNTNPIEAALRECATAKEVAERLKAQGFTHLLVNWTEFARLCKSYGAFEDFDFRKWATFRDECLVSLATFGKPNDVVEYPIVVYEIKK